MSSQSQPAETVRWGGLIKGLNAVRGVVDKTLAAICVVLFVMLVVIVAWQVFTREIMQNSAPWTEEAARNTFVVLAIFAAAYVFSERGHIAVEMLLEKLPLGPQKVVVIVIQLIVSFFFAAVFILGGSLMAQNAWNQDIATLPMSVGQVYLVLPIAGVIILFYELVHIIEVMAGVEAPVPAEEMGEAI